MRVMGISTNIRILSYFSLTLIFFLVSFIPEYIVFYWFFNEQLGNILFYLFAPLILTIVYIISIIIFGLLHSTFAVKLFLPAPKAGKFSHHSGEGRLMALRLISDGLMKSMIKFISWIPIITNKIILPKMLRLYGLKAGKNVHLASEVYIDSCFTELGNNVFIGLRTSISCHYNQDQYLIINKVKIGNDVTVGAHCIVAPGCEIGDNSILGAMSFLVPAQKMDPNSVYIGRPGKKISER
ncbi:MAG: Galactoside O-acetyltransferase [Candidatus Heimdallarchaeota archaeon LC_3]|nr:MAG: Galactoside O-acetyltransferase [Candidatus Heimdallarchaeota archaeon LC_3]